MRIKPKSIACMAFVFVLSITGNAAAGPYVSGAISYNMHEYASVMNTNGYMLGIGYRPDKSNYGFEISYVDAGSAMGAPSGPLTVKGTNYSFMLWLRDSNQLAMYGKLGISTMTSTYVTDVNSTGASFGLGFEFMFNNNYAMFTNMEGYGPIEISTGQKGLLSVWSFGVRYHF